MLRRRPLLLACAALPLAAGRAIADTLPAELAEALPGARLRGRAAMRFLGMHIYDIRLWAPAPLQGDGAAQPLALELQYGRALSGRRIAERSLDEMRRIGRVDDGAAQRWLQAMATLFPDVAAGDRLTGVQRPGQGAQFFHNGRPRGEVPDGEFARLFFGIWLSPRTSEPALRAQLVGP